MFFPCPERVNTMTSYEIEQDTSPDIIYYRKYSIFYLDSPGSSKHFANNSLILCVFYLSITAFLQPERAVPGKAQGWGRHCPLPLTSHERQHRQTGCSQGHMKMKKSCLWGLDLGHCLCHVAFGVNFLYIKRERNEVYLDSPHHV